MKRLRGSLFVGLLAVSGLVACGGDDASDSAVDTAAVTTLVDTSIPPASDASTAPVQEPEVLRILVTNDDGVGADGIDAIVQGLLTLENVEVTVVAPLENQSGTGGSTTDGDLVVTDATTKSGYPAKAVAGFPADTIVWAIDRGGIDFVPDLVVSGINSGQNYSSEIIPISGTVGAARAAAARGIPSVAISQGVGEVVDFPSGVAAGLAWLEANIVELLARSSDSPIDSFANINIPSCAPGTSIRGTVEVPVASLNGSAYETQDCASTVEATSDVTGFQSGFITISELPVSGAPFAD
jgi:5'-nucleotidase